MPSSLIKFAAVYLVIGLVLIAGLAVFLLWKERGAERANSKRTWTQFVRALLPLVGFCLIWPAAAVSGVASLILGRRAKQFRETEREREKLYRPNRSDLRTPMTVSEAELREVVRDPLGGAPELPFGHLNRQWLTFIRGARPSAMVWWYETTVRDSRGQDHFCKGYAFRGILGVKRAFLSEFRSLSI